jgi:hypothetical protein
MGSKVAVAERWMDTPLEEGAWPDLVASLRRRYGPSSAWWSTDTTSLGSALEWRHASAGGVTTTVMLSPREDGTLLRVVKEDSGMENERVMGWLLAAMFGLAPAVIWQVPWSRRPLGWGTLWAFWLSRASYLQVSQLVAPCWQGALGIVAVVGPSRCIRLRMNSFSNSLRGMSCVRQRP